ncbi:MAG: hypothetical protein QXL14_00685 [Candidatus Aenigmatarchaeota archaeon]
MSKIRKQLSIALTGKRILQVAYLYAVLSVLRNKDVRKIVRVIDHSMDIASKTLRETYKEILLSKKEEILRIMNERFNIPAEEAEKYIRDQLNLDIGERMEERGNN